MKKRCLTWPIGILLTFQLVAGTPNAIKEPRVLPLVLNQETWEQAPEYLRVVYYADPEQEPLFEEPAEKVWSLTDRHLLFLGATGQSVPQEIVTRQTAWVRLYWGEEEVGEYLIHPRSGTVAISGDAHHLSLVLARAIDGVDAGYLSQVANYLAGNLATLDVDANSYSITGFGTVVNSSGDWVGNPLPGDTAAGVLAKLITVDGSGSGLDADVLDGRDAGDFVDAVATQTIGGVKTFSSSAQFDLGFTTSGDASIGSASNPAALAITGDNALELNNILGDTYFSIFTNNDNDTFLLNQAGGEFRTSNDLIMRTNSIANWNNLHVGDVLVNRDIEFYTNDTLVGKLAGSNVGAFFSGGRFQVSNILRVTGLADPGYYITLGSSGDFIRFQRGPSSTRDLDLHLGLNDDGELKVYGSFSVSGGTKSFVQPHPKDPEKEIYYVSLEGGEAGTYCRGNGQLKEGRAVINLPEHFSLVTNGEQNLTAQITPLGECNGIFVEKISASRLVVRELGDGASNARFSWTVNGLRAGYEDHQVIRPTQTNGEGR